MSSYSIATAQEQLSRLIDSALGGESVIITRDGKPVAELRAPPQFAEPKEDDYARRLREIAQRKPFQGFTSDELTRFTRGDD